MDLIIPELNGVGYFNGYTYNEHIIEKINSVHPDILIVGLGSPKQEIWIQENKCRLNAKIILAVGDGIKIFAGVKKRGFPVLRKLGKPSLKIHPLHALIPVDGVALRQKSPADR